jgi:hypothetical protein
LTAANIKPPIFSVSGFTLPYAARITILIILYDFCLLPAQFSSIIICMQKNESCVQIADKRAPWKISNGVENFVLQPLQL